MRKPFVALTGCLLLACLGGDAPAGAQQGGPAPPAAAPTPAAPAAVQFGDERLDSGERDMLAHTAQLVGRWAMVQRVVKAVQAQLASPVPAERVQAIDQAWQRGEDPQGLATSLAKNDCAQALQTLVAANPGYIEALATDDQGALVCMSQRTSDYWQGDEETWTRAWAGGSGATFVSRKELDAGTGLELVHIAVPIRSAGRVIGVLVVAKIVAAG